MEYLRFDYSPLLVAILAMLAIVAVVRAVRGSRAGGTPTCRRCGRDARTYAWDPEPTCACGHSLRGRRGVRIPVRRSWISIAAAVALCVAALGVAAAGSIVRARGGSWLGNAPVWTLSALAHAGLAPEFIASAAKRKLEAGLDADDALTLLDALTISRESGAFERGVMLNLAETAMPTGAAGTRFIEALTPWFGGVTYSRSDDGRVSCRLPDWPYAGDVAFAVTIRDVTVNGASVAIDGRDRWTWVDPSYRRDVVLPDPVPPNAEIAFTLGVVARPIRASVAVTDPTLVDPSGAKEWGIPYAEARLERVAIGQIPGRGFSAPSKLPPWLAGFVLDDGTRAVAGGAAAAPYVAALVVGIALGLLLVVVGSIARAIAWGSAQFAPAACVACGSFVRGEGDAPATRCSECGRSLADPRTVRWFTRRRSLGRRLVAAACVVVGVAALGPFAVWTMGGIEPVISRRVATPTSAARASVALAIDGPTQSTRVDALSSLVTGFRTKEESTVVATEISEWLARGAPLERQRPWAIEQSTRYGLAAVLTDAARRTDLPVSPLQALLDAFVARHGPPDGLSIKRCVPVGVPIIPVLTSRMQMPIVARSIDLGSGDVSFANVLFLGQFTEPTTVERSFEWAASPAILARRASFDPPVLRGTVRGTVDVLPAAPRDPVLRDERFDPFRDERRIWMNVRPLGDRVIVRLVRPFLDVGLDVCGTWEADLGDGTWHRLVPQLKDVEWAGVAPRPSALPETIVARFVPCDLRSWATRSSPWLWGGTSVVRFTRAAATPSPGFESLGVEYLREGTVR